MAVDVKAAPPGGLSRNDQHLKKSLPSSPVQAKLGAATASAPAATSGASSNPIYVEDAKAAGLSYGDSAGGRCFKDGGELRYSVVQDEAFEDFGYSQLLVMLSEDSKNAGKEWWSFAEIEEDVQGGIETLKGIIADIKSGRDTDGDEDLHLDTLKDAQSMLGVLAHVLYTAVDQGFMMVKRDV